MEDMDTSSDTRRGSCKQQHGEQQRDDRRDDGDSGRTRRGRRDSRRLDKPRADRRERDGRRREQLGIRHEHAGEEYQRTDTTTDRNRRRGRGGTCDSVGTDYTGRGELDACDDVQ